MTVGISDFDQPLRETMISQIVREKFQSTVGKREGKETFEMMETLYMTNKVKKKATY